jgi:UDP-glucose 4-epimerase
VFEVIRTFEKQTGITINYKFTKQRKGDIATSYFSSKKALRELN